MHDVLHILEQLAVHPEHAPDATYSQLNVQLTHFSLQLPPQVALHWPKQVPEQDLSQPLAQLIEQSEEHPPTQFPVQVEEQPV